jgi:hypothetical protein
MDSDWTYKKVISHKGKSCGMSYAHFAEQRPGIYTFSSYMGTIPRNLAFDTNVFPHIEVSQGIWEKGLDWYTASLIGNGTQKNPDKSTIFRLKDPVHSLDVLTGRVYMKGQNSREFLEKKLSVGH